MMEITTGKRRSSPRVRRKRQQARQEILRAATDALGTSGIDGVTLEAVSSALGMTRQALYHYFPSKEALMRGLVTSLFEDESEHVLAAVERADSGPAAVVAMMRALHAHYVDNLAAFRAIYAQTQLYATARTGLDEATLRAEINPRSHRLFDALEARLAGSSSGPREREAARRYAFVAWTSVLGLLTMLSVADATGDPLIHRDTDLLDTLSDVFERESWGGECWVQSKGTE
jgi:AcrR family transcriptional regulator